MKLPDDIAIRRVLARGYAKDIRAFVERRLSKSNPKQPTVGEVCKRFLLSQVDAVYCIEQGGAGLVVSSFAYTPPPEAHRDGSQGWGKVLLHTFVPQLADDAPVGKRIVMIVEGLPMNSEQLEQALREVVADDTRPGHIRNEASDILHQWSQPLAYALLQRLGFAVDGETTSVTAPLKGAA